MGEVDFEEIERKIAKIKKIYGIFPPAREDALRILENSKRREIQEILKHFSTNNPKIYVDINENIILFEDLIQLDRADIQRICRKFSPSLVALALRLGDKNLRDHFLRGVSGDEREMMEDVLSGAPQKKSDVEAAIGQILSHVRSLQEKGLVNIVGGSQEEGKYV